MVLGADTAALEKGLKDASKHLNTFSAGVAKAAAGIGVAMWPALRLRYLAVMGMMIVVVMPFFNGFERPTFQFPLIPGAVIGGALFAKPRVTQQQAG